VRLGASVLGRFVGEVNMCPKWTIRDGSVLTQESLLVTRRELTKNRKPVPTHSYQTPTAKETIFSPKCSIIRAAKLGSSIRATNIQLASVTTSEDTKSERDIMNGCI